MSIELSNGVIIPEEYSDDWYDEMSINLRKLNDVITAASDNATDIQRLDTDKANQSDLTALTSRVSQNETDITALQTAVSGALKREIVQTLPTQDISTTTIYMIRNSQSSGTNIYDEYMYINSQWELIGTSATDFSNYYTKNETDNLLSGKVDNSTLGSYYTKTESDNLLLAKANQTDLTALSGRVTQTETDITALQTAVSGALKREIVQTLPTQDISTTTIYMIRNTTTSGDNIYDEYMYINNLWELIGTSATDFSNYYTKNETDTLLSGKANDNSVVHTSGNEDVTGVKSFINYLLGKNLSGQTVDLNDCVDAYGGATHYYYAVSNYTNISNKPENKPFILISKTVRYVSSIDYIYHQKLYTADYNAPPSIYTRYYRSGSSSWSNWVKDTDKFVTTDTNQNISGIKTFTDNIIPKKIVSNVAQLQVNARSDADSVAVIGGANAADGGGVWVYGKNSSNNSMVTLQVYDTVNSTYHAVRLYMNGALCPTVLNDGLGSQSYKWVSFNGLTPSSLSLASTTGVVDISSYITDLTGTANTYTVLVNGFIQFDVTGSSVEIDVTNGLSQKWIMTDPKGFIPVVSGASVSIKVIGTAINNFKFIPCQGNI